MKKPLGSYCAFLAVFDRGHCPKLNSIANSNKNTNASKTKNTNAIAARFSGQRGSS
jgi:hypothetical protein